MAEPEFEPPQDPELIQAILKNWRKQAVQSAEDAEEYGERLTGNAYGIEQVRAQEPFHAKPTDNGWRVTGSKPMNKGLMSGPITLVFDRDGTVRNIFFTLAPIGWEKDLKRSTPSR